MTSRRLPTSRPGRLGSSVRVGDRVSRSRIVGAAVLVVVVLTAVTGLSRSSFTDQVDFGATVQRVEIDLSIGDVTITRTDADDGRFTMRTDDGWVRSARTSHRIDGETLTITGNCRGHRFIPAFGCHTDVTLVLPAGVEVVAETLEGSISTHELRSTARLEARTGRVVVDGHTGDLSARSTGADVVVTGLTAQTARVTSSAGTVHISAARPPVALDAESSEGAVTVELPRAPSYDVEAKSRADAATVETVTSHASPHKIRAFSDAGPVSVSSR